MEQKKGSRLISSLMNMRRQLVPLIDAGTGELSHGEYLVLRNIGRGQGRFYGQEGPVKAAKLSELLEVSRPAITRILNGLENRGYITRHIDKADRRSINIALTDTGRRALDAANQRISATADRLVSSLGDEDAEKLIQLLDRLTEIYTGMLHEKGH